jgi:CHAD domain-containing protein
MEEWRKGGVLGLESYHEDSMPQAIATPEVALRVLTQRWNRALNGDADAVHAVRVATRRLREALRLLDGHPREGRKLRRVLKRITRRLGPVREVDVGLALVAQISTERPDLLLACDRVRLRLTDVGAARRARLAKRLDDLDIKAAAGRIDRHLRHARVAGVAAAAGLDRARLVSRVAARAEAVSVAAESAGGLYAPEALHDVRIAAKKLRYALEVARTSRVTGAATAATRLRKYQDLLGRLHDLQILAAHVARLQARLPVDDEDLGALSDLLVYLEDRCRMLHATFVERRAPLVTLTSELASGVSQARSAARHA